MTGNVFNYYASGNTAKGFYNLFENNLVDLNNLFILEGGLSTGKSILMKIIGSQWIDKGNDIEYLHCLTDNDLIDGVINIDLKIGIVDSTATHIIEPTAPGAIREYVNLSVAWDSSKLKPYTNAILDLETKISNCYKTAYEYFGKALKIHDEWEKIYIENMNFEKADRLTEEVIYLLLKDNRLEKHSKVKHRFLGAATPKGPVDFVENLTSTVSKRYFIKGRPGTGKSTFLKKLQKISQDRGYDVEVYHCGFDPNSLDMIILRELDVCIFDSTAPHEHFPSRENDEIIDLYKELITPGTDEKYKNEIYDISMRYKIAVSKGTLYLKQAKELHDQLEKLYGNATDFNKIDEMTEELILTISKC
ncbi:MAG: PRK06851 family protein [Clostridiaceae bacterium]